MNYHQTTHMPSIDNKGFSLVEVLVSLALFMVVVTMSVGTLLVLIDANSSQRDSQVAVTNISFALDSMTREIRTGYFYECRTTSSQLQKTNTYTPSDCTTGAQNFSFVESGGSLTGGMTSNRIAYRYNAANKSIERRLGDPNANGINWRPITAPEVQIDTFSFIVTDTHTYADNGNLRAPTVTIFVSGRAIGSNQPFDLETTVTQQVLDI